MTERPAELVALDRLVARGAPYEDLRAAIDDARARGDGAWWMPGVAQHWAAACVRHGRPLAECREAAELLLAEEPHPVARASSLLGLCRLHSELALELLPDVVVELARVVEGLTELRQLVDETLDKARADSTAGV
jgi:hypothetical protein